MLGIGFLMLRAAAAADGPYSVDVRLDRPEGIYRSGDTVTCTAALRKAGRPAAGETGRYTVRFERGEIAAGTFDAGREWVFSVPAEKPGWFYFGFEVLGDDGTARRGPRVQKHSRKPTIVGEIGAMVDPEKIRAAPSRPADFDAFWADVRARLDRVPLDPELTPVDVPEAYRGRVVCMAVSAPCPGKNPVTGYLAVPADAGRGSLPALVSYQGLVWTDANPQSAMRAAAERRTLALFVSWHGLPTGQPAAFYSDKSKTWYAEEGRAGDTDPKTWFYHDMFYRVLRALDVVKHRPEWNGKDLIIQGGSLGGGQAIAAAALDRAVTLAVVNVPSFCEFNGYLAGRGSVLSYRYEGGIERLQADPRRPAALAYHDAVNFAPRIRCEIFVSTGFTDELCTPSSVYAFYNALPAGTKKVMSTSPWTGHYGTTPNPAGDRRLEDVFRGIRGD